MSSRGGDGDVLTSCAGQKRILDGSEAQAADYEIARRLRGRSTPAQARVWVLERVRSVPDAGELQTNVSLTNADKVSRMDRGVSVRVRE